MISKESMLEDLKQSMKLGANLYGPALELNRYFYQLFQRKTVISSSFAVQID